MFPRLQRRPADKEVQDLQKDLDETELSAEQVPPAEPPEQALLAGQDLQTDQDGAQQVSIDGEAAGQAIPQSKLNEALLRYGSDAVDGHPHRQLQGSSGSNQCPVPGCELPGGHRGVHQGPEGRFLYGRYEGKKMVTEEADSDDGVDPGAESSSTSSEELMPDTLHVAQAEPAEQAPQEIFFALELPVDADDYEWLSKNCVNRKANIWLSRKMAEKSKEVQWKELTLDQKKLFDIAKAKELNQVATSRALRNITKDESLNLDKRCLWPEVRCWRCHLSLPPDG